MLLQEKETNSLVEVLDIEALINPAEDVISVQKQSGQEEQDPEKFEKTKLIFPSGETLPRCWLDANYRTN